MIKSLQLLSYKPCMVNRKMDGLKGKGEMGKRCRKCKVPLEGFLYWLIASKMFGLQPSTKDPELCNKCEGGQGTLWPTQSL